MEIPIMKADISANVFVNANGLNNLPSCACIANTGKKLITVVSIAVNTAPDTSETAL